MEPRRTRSLAALVAGFDQLSPGRDRSTDGWIGDDAHQQYRSGHNPDDTPGSLPEYVDGDDVPEVRAVDVDADLRHPTVDMGDAIARILATPADRRRLRYVIWQRRIASASSGWVWRAYDGDNPHTAHAHFSGDPDYDDDDRPWSVASMGGTDVVYSEAAMRAFPWQYNGSGMPGVPERRSTLWVLGSIYSTATANAGKLDAIAAALAGHANGDWLRERFAEIDQRFTDLARSVGEVPDAVVGELGGAELDDVADALAAAGVDLDALALVLMERAASSSSASGEPLDVSGPGEVPGSVTVEGATADQLARMRATS